MSDFDLSRNDYNQQLEEDLYGDNDRVVELVIDKDGNTQIEDFKFNIRELLPLLVNE